MNGKLGGVSYYNLPLREQVAMAPIRSGASAKQKPRGKLNPGMAAVREGPLSRSSNINNVYIIILQSIDYFGQLK